MEHEIKRVSFDDSSTVGDSSVFPLDKSDSVKDNTKCEEEKRIRNNEDSEYIDCQGQHQEPRQMEQNGSVTTELSSDEAPQCTAIKEKQRQIEAVLSEDKIDAVKLKSFALSDYGLINDDLRRKIWPKLLGIDTQAATEPPSQKELEAHSEYHQVVLDVDRSLKRFPPGIPYEQRVALLDQLTRLILRVIIKYPHLKYYQGYHDVAVTFLLVVGEAVAFQIMEKLSTEHLKDCMEPTMDKTSHLLNYIYPLIRRLHPQLHDYMERSDVGTMFCLPWFLTWYGHSLNQYRDVVRLYDFFLVSPPLMPLYLSACLVAHRSSEVFDVDCDMASIHSLLSEIPDDLPFELLLKQATELYETFPPQSVEAEVRERFERELQLRRYDRPRMPRRHRNHFEAIWRHIFEVNRMIPPWAIVPHMVVPRFRSRFVLVTTAALVGLYAYFRMADALDISSTIPVR